MSKPKLVLNLDALEVESFDTVRGITANRGTVRGHATEYTACDCLSAGGTCNPTFCEDSCLGTCPTCGVSCEGTCGPETCFSCPCLTDNC
jgi:hypothetical protein